MCIIHQSIKVADLPPIPTLHCLKQAATDGTKPDLNIGETKGLAAWFRAKIYIPVCNRMAQPPGSCKILPNRRGNSLEPWLVSRKYYPQEVHSENLIWSKNWKASEET